MSQRFESPQPSAQEKPKPRFVSDERTGKTYSSEAHERLQNDANRITFDYVQSFFVDAAMAEADDKKARTLNQIGMSLVQDDVNQMALEKALNALDIIYTDAETVERDTIAMAHGDKAQIEYHREKFKSKDNPYNLRRLDAMRYFLASKIADKKSKNLS